MKVISPIITIDGPSGAGKGTLCQALAKDLQWNLLDSGALYRALSLAALHHRVPLDNEEALLLLAQYIDISFAFKNNKLTVMLQGKDVSRIIRNEIIGNTASKIAQFSRVRQILLRRQREFRVAPGLIADGRDMGTIVFPDAPVKIFLDVSCEERAHRRMQQLQHAGFSVNFVHLLSEIKERDARDYNRAVAPLFPAPDALVLDATCLTIDEVIVKTLTLAKQILMLSSR